jgi:cardiolipin synthase A/B
MIISLILLGAHVLGVISSFHAIMGTRTSQGAVAWVVSLNTFPLIAVPAYWVLGRNNFHGYVLERQQENETVQSALADFRRQHPDLFAPHGDSMPVARAAERLAWMPILNGNRVDLLIDGAQTFDSILAGIAEAEDYVLVQFYIVRDDELGRRLRDALVERSQAGVRTYLLYDEVGSAGLPEAYLQSLRAAGVEARNFHSRKGPQNRFQINFRNHRKIVVCDGRVGWVGGHNVGDEYIDGGEKFASWRDTHIRVQGPAVLPLQWVFLEDWNWAADEMLSLAWEPGLEVRGDQEVLIIPSGPADERETATLMFMHAINSAQDRIWIASPYFVPDAGVIHALQLALLRGVDVRVLIPDEPDHLLVYLAAFSYLQEVGPDLKVWRYTAGFMHQKALLIDDRVACIGTANFDNRSFRLNFEITAMIIDRDFNKQVEQMFERDFQRSQPMDPLAIRERSYWFQLKSRAASLFAPIL